MLDLLSSPVIFVWFHNFFHLSIHEVPTTCIRNSVTLTLITQLFTSTRENFHPKFNVNEDDLCDRIDACANWIASLFSELLTSYLFCCSVFFISLLHQKHRFPYSHHCALKNGYSIKPYDMDYDYSGSILSDVFNSKDHLRTCGKNTRRCESTNAYLYMRFFHSF